MLERLVVTGATSGIGLATARLAVHRGARVLLVSRDEDQLRNLAWSLDRRGTNVGWIRADVSARTEVQAIAARATQLFGGADGWIHCAGAGLYAPALATDLHDHRRLFDVNLWGTLHCVRTAVEQMREHGGSVVVISSVLADRAVPWQGATAASEHARKAWCDALRMELRHDRIPVRITVLQVGGIDTPFVRHAAASFGLRPALPTPLYHPSVVARAALHCVRAPRRDFVLGDVGLVAIEKIAPRLGDRLLERRATRKLGRTQPTAPDAGLLHEPLPREGLLRGTPHRRVFRHSLRAALGLHRSAVALAAVGLAGAAFARQR